MTEAAIKPREIKRYRARINPANRDINPQTDEWFRRDCERLIGVYFQELIPEVRKVAAEGQVDIGAERWGSPELAILVAARGLAHKIVSHEMVKRGIGMPYGLESYIFALDEDVEEFTYEDDPTVPFGEAILERIA